MPINGFDSNKCITIEVDNSKIDNILQDFPTLINISNNSGLSNFNCKDFFDELNFGSVDDDFTGANGEAPKSILWDNSSSNFDIYNNKLRITKTYSGAGVWYPMVSLYKIKNDCSFTADFSATTLDNNNKDSVELQLLIDNNNFVLTKLEYNSGIKIRSDSMLGGTWTGNTETSISYTLGSNIELKISRSGTKVYTSYKLNDTWYEHTNFNYSTFGNDAYVKIGLWCAAGTPLSYVDSFTVNSGTVVWPNGTHPNRKKIAIEYAGYKDHYITISGSQVVQSAPNNQQCYTEIENWDVTVSGNESVQLWAKIPEIASEVPTKVYLYYDNTASDNTTYIGDTGDAPAQNVWGSDYRAVYHMVQDPSSTAPQILDSTLNLNHGTSMGTMTSNNLVEGLISKAIVFDGTDDKIQLPGNVIEPTLCTMTGLIKSTVGGVVIGRGGEGETQETNLCDFKIYTNNNTPPSSYFFETGNGANTAVDLTAQFSSGNFEYFNLSILNNGYMCYKNDILSDTGTGVGNSDTTALYSYIADNGSGNGEEFEGTIERIIIYNNTPSSSWSSVAYYTMIDSLLTYTYEQFIFNGYVTVENIPATRTVFLYHRASGKLVGTAISNGINGYFEISSPYNDLHFVVIIPKLEESFNLLTYDKINPEY
jgi:hypothetical protein